MSALQLPNITKDASPNLTLRLVLLRTICCLTFVSFIYTLVTGLAWPGFWRPGTINYQPSPTRTAEYCKPPINLFILLHHIAIPFFPRFRFFNGLGDLIITTAEIATLVWVVTSMIVNSWSARISIVAATIWWMLLISVAMFAMLKIINTIAVKGKNLLVRLDITDARWMYRGSNSGPGDTKKLTASDVLLGRSLWNAKLAGEQKWMILSRGFFAVLFVIIMVIFAIVAVILAPVRESALTPVNIFLAYAFPLDTTINPPGISVVLTRTVTNETSMTSREKFGGAVRTTLLNNSQPCAFYAMWTPLFADGFSGSGDPVDGISFDCNLTLSTVTHPDILVTVNFTELGIRSDTIDNVVRNSVQVLLNFAGFVKPVVDNTLPVTLIPGMNVFAMSNVVVRKQLQVSGLSTFGLFDYYDTFFISEISQLTLDPSSSPLITRSPDVATIRIVTQVDPYHWKVIQDSREKSVLKGFSSVGGLWTSLCGIFTIIFGSSLLRIIFNVKPFSIFGLIHSTQRARIRDSCLREYPRVPDDMNMLPGDRGVISLLSDYFIDLTFLRPDEQNIPDVAIPLTSMNLMSYEDTESQQQSQTALLNDDSEKINRG